MPRAYDLALFHGIQVVTEKSNPPYTKQTYRHNEKCRLLGYKNPGRTSQETHYVSVREQNRLMLWKIWGLHGGDWRIPSSEIVRRVAPVRTDISQESSASIIRVTRIRELGTTLAVTSNPRALRKNIMWEKKRQYGIPDWGWRVTTNVVPSHRLLSPWCWTRYVPPKRRFLQEPHGLTSQKTAFFIITAAKTSNLT
jgi:hypothetical protein